MNDPSRDVWQKPKEVIKALAITPGAPCSEGLRRRRRVFHLVFGQRGGARQGAIYAVNIDDGAELDETEMNSRGMTNVVSSRRRWII